MTEEPTHVVGLVGTGHQQEATPHRQDQASDRLASLYTTAVKSETHLWLVILTHVASPTMLDSADGEPVKAGLLDLDTMVGVPAVACYVCETGYEPRLRRRKCAGDPDPASRSIRSGGAL